MTDFITVLKITPLTRIVTTFYSKANESRLDQVAWTTAWQAAGLKILESRTLIQGAPRVNCG